MTKDSMTTSNRVFGLLAFSFGLFGLILCLAALIGVWNLSAQLRRATDTVFDMLDETVTVVHDRTGQTREHLEAAKITTDEVAATLQDWTRREAGQQVAQRLGLDEKTEQLASMMHNADHWLDVSESSVGLIQKTLSVASSAGAPVDPSAVDEFLQDLSTLRTWLADATKLVAQIHERTAEEDAEKPLQQRLQEAARLALRVAATLGTIDDCLEEFTNRLSETREDLREWEAKTRWWIRLGTLVATLLILWMVAGQVALCFLGRKAVVPRLLRRE